MSDISTMRTAPATANPFSMFLRGVATFAESFRIALRQTQYYEQLSHLSDAQLERRGLRREDVPRHVMEAFR